MVGSVWIFQSENGNNGYCRSEMEVFLISIHCENGHIVESCEITATVAPSAD